MQTYLRKNYQFRANLLRECTEWRRSSQDEWQQMDNFVLNSIYYEVQNEGFQVNFKDLERLLFSSFVERYHPFRDFLSGLPAWDGKDRIVPLARRVSQDKLWALVFHRWMRAMVAQWMGCDMLSANSMVPVLVSKRQGLGKSTFWRSIVPEQLRPYYMDKIEFTATGEYDRMMAQCGLINLDELDSFSARAMSKFKAATQMTDITGHSVRHNRITNSRRLASFCATTNKVDILTDPTGSRRFFCVNVMGKINCSRPISYEQIYAQLVHEVKMGETTWFDKREEKRIERHNASFYVLTPLQKALLAYFRIPEMADEANGEASDVTSSEMLRIVARHRPTLIAGVPASEVGREASRLFPVVKRSGQGNLYRVVSLWNQQTRAAS